MTKHKTKLLLGAGTLVFGVLSGAAAVAVIYTQYHHILKHFFQAS